MNAAWDYRDPLEPALSAQVSDKTLMEHRARSALSGASRQRAGTGVDYIERVLKSYGVEVERRGQGVHQLAAEGRVHLPDGGAIEEPRIVLDVGRSARGQLSTSATAAPPTSRANAAGRSRSPRSPAPGRAWAAQRAGRWADFGHAGPPTGVS
jgi:hypothetical protein